MMESGSALTLRMMLNSCPSSNVGMTAAVTVRMKLVPACVPEMTKDASGARMGAFPTVATMRDPPVRWAAPRELREANVELSTADVVAPGSRSAL